MMWQTHMEHRIFALGFSRIEGWPSAYHHAETGCAFIVYVDDFVMIGPSKKLKALIQRVNKVIEMEEPTSLSKYLGCKHKSSVTYQGKVRTTETTFDMSEYLNTACDLYEAASGRKCRNADSPYAPELPLPQLLELCAEVGDLQPHAASLLMKLLYAARMSRPDLCTAITRLASRISRWDKDCDRRTHRLYDYVRTSANVRLKGCLSTDDFDEFVIHAWPDADQNGDAMSSKSTSGRYVEFHGKGGANTFPACWSASKQTATCSSTCEAETVSLSDCMKKDAIPIQMLMSLLLGKPVDVVAHEDNAACIIAVQKGYSPALRALPRTQRCAIGTLHEIFHEHVQKPDEGRCLLVKEPTETHKGDIFTKELQPHKFKVAVQMLKMS